MWDQELFLHLGIKVQRRERGGALGGSGYPVETVLVEPSSQSSGMRFKPRVRTARRAYAISDFSFFSAL